MYLCGGTLRGDYPGTSSVSGKNGARICLRSTACVIVGRIISPATTIAAFSVFPKWVSLFLDTGGRVCRLTLHHYHNTAVTLFLTDHFLMCAIISNGLGLVASYYFVYVRYPKLSPPEQKANQLRRAPTAVVGVIDAVTNSKKTTDKAAPSSKNTNKSDTNSSKQPPQPLGWDDRGVPFFNGKEFNPRWKISVGMGGDTKSKFLDVKMLLYLIGAIVLELNILGAVCYEQALRHQHGNSDSNSNAILLYAGLFTWFVLDYLWYEEVHLYTYDLFAEKVGFKLSWGCLCFYPFFYAIGVLPFVMMDSSFYHNHNNDNHDLSIPTMLFIGCIYILGSTLTRGANMQKFQFRCQPRQSSLSLFGGMLVVQQESLPSSNGRLLCSGFWGLSRHVNYLGEILQAVALALPAWLYLPMVDEGTTGQFVRWLPWLYPLYYVALFLPRQIDDEELMRQKYGDDVMNEYIQLVPYRMVPGLY